MLEKSRALLVLGVVSAQAVLLPLTASQAASPPARSGHCTIVGTPHADHLVGTSHHDVICGRGGDDTLIGKGGDDVLVGGSGADDLVGGAGNDTLDGGAGRDQLSGQGGNDHENAGSGPDNALGGGGRDLVAGGRGNDDLTGGPKADTIDGGPGTNWCTVDPDDTADACVYDLTPAVADTVELSTDTVDVTDSEQSVSMRIHVTDDTGATAVVVNPDAGTPWFPDRIRAELVSGDVRDGWWEATVTFPRWVKPGTYVPSVRTWDRVGRENTNVFDDTTVTVLDDDPDLDLPDLTLLSPDPATSYDDRTADGVEIPLKAHITDAGSGVDPDHMFVILWSPSPGGYAEVGLGGGLHLANGDLHDGIWKGSVWVDQGRPGGDWNLEIFVSDKANRDTQYGADYWGPGMFGGPANQTYRDNRPIPDGMGTVHVIGSAPDTEPPTVSDVSVTPDTVDTLSSSATVDISVDAEDTGGAGLLGVSAMLRPVDWEDGFPYLIAGLGTHDGSGGNGTYTGQLELPQGLPPGTYYLEILAYDNADNASYYIGSGFPGSWFDTRLDNNPTVTVVDSSGH